MPPDAAPFEYVATFIARPEHAASLSEVVDEAADLPTAGRPDWLAPGEACDIALPAAASSDLAAVRDDLFEMIDGRPVDVVVQPIASRRKRLLVADMDSTMIGQECIDELADMAGLKPYVAAITERAMRGEIAFEPALRERVGLLKGLPLGVIDTVLAERIKLTPGGPELVRTMKAAGAYTALVSGGFTLFTGPVAAMIGFDENRANQLNHEGGVLDGTVTEPILGQEAKLSALMDLSRRFGLSRHETLAIGDGANDLAMVRAAGLGIAYHAKPKVAAEADARIDHTDLTAILFAQGYRRTEFAA
ncbi:phosphoserine phosphatase SerB [Kaistia dalseonensis]|uniref:Phosphoserine phosphatase n=1 Tax=Kaistia dalseonensis TaxID=410840 RepID=A0ABU0HBN1_9HYPH|nr:phosphoserine phosphatase SerB [Kaistia dalseonensis]MCX5497093.1 phosphoserine phosphatase SerB [Kaistia dalseonensis]MDQ0439719.1 phosphoserine phosphatase [Kaistia dalseonensis]